MISYSPVAVEPNRLPAIAWALSVAAICFATGYFLGNGEGREERQLLRRVFAVMESVESTKVKHQPCLSVFQPPSMENEKIEKETTR